MDKVDLSDEGASRGPDTLAGEVDERPDPRIQVQLERLNTATDTINKLEVDLDEARMLFRQLLTDSTQRIDALAKRLGKCIEQSRPYYEARIHAKQALRETQGAAVRYERAMSQHNAAREMVLRTETGLMEKGCIFDDTWQEMLNHATYKVNDAEREKMESACEHRRTSVLYHEAETRVKALQKELKRAIAKSSLNARRSLLQMNNLVRMHQLQLLPYFELKAAVNHQLEGQKREVKRLEESVAQAKLTYSDALATLETISNEIHQNRQSQLDLGVRGIGVGAESPLPPAQLQDEGGSVDPHKVPLPQPSTYLHYPSSSSSCTSTQEYKSLPLHLGPAAAPIMETLKSREAAAPHDAARLPASDSSRHSNQTAEKETEMREKEGGEVLEGREERKAEVAGEENEGGKVLEVSRERKAEAGEVVVEEVDGAATSTDLTGWQVIGLGVASAPATQHLTVEDRDSAMSDTESLASIEMLSDEAIDGLMLEEELADASTSICQASDTPTQILPSFFHSYQNDINVAGKLMLTTPSSMVGRENGSQNNDISMSLAALQLNLVNRQYTPPHSLHLQRDSSSDHSSLEDLTPGYAPLQDTPYSPQNFPLPAQRKDANWLGHHTTSLSSEEESQEPHCSSWFLQDPSNIEK